MAADALGRRRILRDRLSELLAVLGVRGGASAARLLSRLAPLHRDRQELDALWLVARNRQLQKKLRHLPGVTLEVLVTLRDKWRMLDHPAVFRELAAHPDNPFHVLRVIGALEGVRRLEKHLRAAPSVWPSRVRLEQVRRRRDRIHAKLLSTQQESLADLPRLSREEARNFSKAADKKKSADLLLPPFLKQFACKDPGVFPPPPFPGNENIQPISTAGKLLREGKRLRNCLREYRDNIAAGDSAIYRIVKPEPGALELCISKELEPGGFPVRLEECKLAFNAPIDQATRRVVRDWMERCMEELYRVARSVSLDSEDVSLPRVEHARGYAAFLATAELQGRRLIAGSPKDGSAPEWRLPAHPWPGTQEVIPVRHLGRLLDLRDEIQGGPVSLLRVYAKDCWYYEVRGPRILLLEIPRGGLPSGVRLITPPGVGLQPHELEHIMNLLRNS
ncbi:MAG: hypothetical protein ACOCVM_00380 [Desulfovibrionaceae bacterium]